MTEQEACAARDAIEARVAAIRAKSREEALAILAPMTDAEAAHYLAKWHIRPYVARGDSEQHIATSWMSIGCAMGSVSVEPGRKIHVNRIGPWGEGGHDCDVTFSLHTTYEEVKRELAAVATQPSLWDEQVSEVKDA